MVAFGPPFPQLCYEVFTEKLSRAGRVLSLSDEKLTVLLIHCSAIERVVPAGNVANCDAGTSADPLESHYHPPAKANDVLP